MPGVLGTFITWICSEIVINCIIFSVNSRWICNAGSIVNGWCSVQFFMDRKIKLNRIFGRESSVTGNLYSCIKIASERRKEEVFFQCSSKWRHGIATMPSRKLRQFIPLKRSTEQNAVCVCVCVLCINECTCVCVYYVLMNVHVCVCLYVCLHLRF